MLWNQSSSSYICIFSKFIFSCFCPCIFCLSVKRECSGIGEMWMGHSAMLIPLARCIEPGCNWNNQHHCHRHNHHHQHRYDHHPRRFHHQQHIIIDSISNHQNHSKLALSSFPSCHWLKRNLKTMKNSGRTRLQWERCFFVWKSLHLQTCNEWTLLEPESNYDHGVDIKINFQHKNFFI